MGKFYIIPRTSWVAYSATHSDANSVYPATNLSIYEHLRRRSQSTQKASSINIVFDMSNTSQVVAGVFLDDVNFTSVTIQGNSEDSWGGTPPYSQAITIAKDERVQRYKYFHIPVAFAYRYLRILIAGGQTTTDGLSAYRIGRVAIVNAVNELNQNPFYPYSYTAPMKYVTTEMESGAVETVKVGSYKVWSTEWDIGYLEKANEASMWEIDAVGQDQLFILYENEGDFSKAYICYQKGMLSITQNSNPVVSTSKYSIEEKV